MKRSKDSIAFKNKMVKRIAKSFVDLASIFSELPCLGLYFEPEIPEELKRHNNNRKGESK